jgi:HSP20 family protein
VSPADLLVDHEGVTLALDVPGLRVDDLDIELENDTLTVRGRRPFRCRERR